MAEPQESSHTVHNAQPALAKTKAEKSVVPDGSHVLYDLEVDVYCTRNAHPSKHF